MDRVEGAASGEGSEGAIEGWTISCQSRHVPCSQDED